MSEAKAGVKAGEIKASKPKPIRFKAQVIKVQTMTDGAIRITLDMSETDISTASKLMEVRTRGGLLEIAALPIEGLFNKQDHNATKGRKQQPCWTPAES